MKNTKSKTLALTVGLSIASQLIPMNALAGDPSAVGDVVGRELSFPGLGAFGHVGIWDGSKVMEVLMPEEEDDDVIQKNRLSNFKAQSDYWGARYEDAKKLYRVVSAGWDQREYDPEYTLAGAYREGGYEDKCVKRNASGKCTKTERRMVTAKFRCDSFVQFAFRKGVGIELVGATITPRKVFNGLDNER